MLAAPFTSAWEFGSSVRERAFEGQGRELDVAMTGGDLIFSLLGVYGAYSAARSAGVVQTINRAAAAESRVEAGLSFPTVRTDYGIATQDLSAAALELRSQVEAGLPLYRAGTLGRNAAGEAQFWAPESPFNPGYSARYGTPFSEPNFILGGTLREGSVYTTGPAAALGSNPGGALEIVTEPGAVHLDFFHMID
jgi:hypothetical protein